MKKLLFLLAFTSFIQFTFAQNVGIGTSSPNPNAILDIRAPNKGLLIPRMDSSVRKSIQPTRGLMVYDTSTNSFWYNTGTAWSTFMPKGTQAGQMLVWNGASWINLAPGTPGQYLGVSDSLLPKWSTINLGGVSNSVATSNIADIAPTSARSGGNIITDNGSPIIERGVVWSTDPNPTVNLSTKTSDGSGIGYYISSIDGLQPATTYYIRAYATSANGTTYGNQISFATFSEFTIGQEYEGGLIAYIDGTGQHGLIVSPEDLSTGITWNYFDDVNTNARGLSIGTGVDNTDLIISSQGQGSYAASLCRDFYSGGGYTDWYLPSLYELNELFRNRAILDISSGNGYWSSSEIDSFTAWIIDFGASGPNQYQYAKNNTVSVRAVRRF